MFEELHKDMELKEDSLSRKSIYWMRVCSTLTIISGIGIFGIDYLPDFHSGAKLILVLAFATFLLASFIYLASNPFWLRIGGFYPMKKLDEWELRIKAKVYKFGFTLAATFASIALPLMIYLTDFKGVKTLNAEAVSDLLGIFLILIAFTPTAYSTWIVSPLEADGQTKSSTRTVWIWIAAVLIVLLIFVPGAVGYISGYADHRIQ